MIWTGLLVNVTVYSLVALGIVAAFTTLRRRMRLTQEALAQRIGAAGKAVVYQWESRKRTPSPVFWERVEALGTIVVKW